jgi:2-polyprenyl-3-methyl-5-hydroxy-6-metoxy-1,4-benzoquinol methylase
LKKTNSNIRSKINSKNSSKSRLRAQKSRVRSSPGHRVLSNYSSAGLIVKSYILARGYIFNFKRIVDFVPKNTKKIIDIGCGYGLLDFILADSFKNAKIIASDLNSKRINYLKKANKHKNLSFECRDAVASRTDADVIICVDLLHHISFEAQVKLLKKIHKNAPDDVTFIVKDMDKGRYSFRQLVNFGIDLVSARQYPLFYHNRQSFEELFKKNGFTVEKVAYLNKRIVPLNHILFVLKKTKSKK